MECKNIFAHSCYASMIWEFPIHWIDSTFACERKHVRPFRALLSIDVNSWVGIGLGSAGPAQDLYQIKTLTKDYCLYSNIHSSTKKKIKVKYLVYGTGHQSK